MNLKNNHLPYYEPLKDYPSEHWLVFGTLTHRYETRRSVQIERFHTLMTAIGLPNKTVGKRLHWILRTENGDTSKQNVDEQRLHIHFLLSDFKILNGHKHIYTYESLVTSIRNNWPYGRVDLPRYDPKLDGLGYILKEQSRDAGVSEEEVKLSRSLMTFLATKKQYDAIDPLASLIYHSMKLAGVSVSYGKDEIPNRKFLGNL